MQKQSIRKKEKLIILKRFHDYNLGGHLRNNKTNKKNEKQLKRKGIKDYVKNYTHKKSLYQTNKVTNKKIKN